VKAITQRASWFAVGAVAVLCAVLGFLQYRWIGQVSAAERIRLRDDLHFALVNLSRAIGPVDGELDLTQVSALAARYLAQPGLSDYELEIVATGPTQSLVYASNPAEKQVWKRPDAIEPIFDRRPFDGGGPPGPPPPEERQFGRRGPGGPPVRWLILARYKAGSLEALVVAAKQRNLAVTGAILLMILGIAAVLVTLTRRAQVLAEAQIGFVAGVSHELRTPLTVIRTAAFNLTSPKFQSRPEQVERYGRLITAESEKLEGLIDQVLRFAAGSAGHAIRELRPVDLGPVIEDEVRALGDGAVQVEVRIEPDLPPAPADEQALRHALRNLLDNAVRYGDGKPIGVIAKKITFNRFPHVQIEVADRGPGIPADEIGRVFDPFFRGSRAIRDQIHGTGLGLNIVKKITEAHGGEVSVRSDPGAGTHFLLRLPCPANLTVWNPDDNANSVD